MRNELKSKLKLAPFIAMGLFPLGLFVAFGIPKIITTINVLEAGKTNDASGVFIPILAFLLVIFIFIRYLNRFPKLTINREGIVFSALLNSTKHDWNEIENIELTGKKSFGKFFRTPTEAVTFNFKNGEIKHIWIEQYSNASEIRVVLERAQKVIADKSLSFDNLYFGIDIPQNQIEDIELDEGEVFNDNHVLSGNGILVYGILVFSLWMILEKSSKMIDKYEKLPLIILPFLIICGAFSYQMNYFIFTDKYLIVKNSIWFWKKKFHKIDDIKEIVIDRPHRSSISLRIISNNYDSNVYQASSLRTSTWKRLLSHLEQKNIKVRDEVINLK